MSVCLSIVLQQIDVISHRVPLSAHEKSFDLAGVVNVLVSSAVVSCACELNICFMITSSAFQFNLTK
jgi:hypothetical protein